MTTTEKRKDFELLAFLISTKLLINHKIDKAINAVLEQALESLKIQDINVMLRDGDLLSIKFRAQVGIKRAIEDEKVMKIGDGIAGTVAKTNQLMAVPNTSYDSSYMKKSNSKPKSLLTLPVTQNSEVIGVLNLSKPANELFTDSDVNSAKMIASGISSILEGNKLYNELKVQKRTFEKVLETTTDGLILVNKSLRLLFANKAAISSLPLSEKEIAKNDFQPYLDSRSKKIAERFKKLILKSIVEKKSLSAEFLPRKGSAKILSLKFNPIIEKGGRCSSVLIGINNITKLKEKQETVEKQVKQITNLFKISSMSQDTDDKEFIDKVLAKTEEILESETSNILIFDRKIAESLHEFNVPKEVFKLTQKINDTEKPKAEYLNNAIKSNYPEIKNIRNFIAAPLKFKNKVIGILYAMNKKGDYHSGDSKLITIIGSRISSQLESILLFEEIARDNEQMQNIIANTGDGIIVRNSAFRIVIFNKAMKQLTGFDNAKDYTQANPETSIQIRRILKEFILTKKNAIYREIKISDSDKQEKWLGVTYSFIKNRSNDITYMISVIRDISKEKEIDNQQREFIYTAAHELRTPITVIKGYLSMILGGDTGEITEKQKTYFDRTLSSANKLSFLVEDLLEATRLEEGRSAYSIQSFNAYDLVKSVIADFSLKAKTKRLKLAVPIKSSKDTFLLGDYEKTRQAMSNLVDNAIKYSRKGDIKILVKKDGDRGQIEITDSGVGILKKDIPRIFDKFVRIHNTESIRAGGTGLGLYIVKNMIEQQGGEIYVKSQIGQGSTFSISLPLAKQLKLNWR